MSEANERSTEKVWGERWDIEVKIGATPSSTVYHRLDCNSVDAALTGSRSDIEAAFPHLRPAKCCFPEEYDDSTETEDA
jgi:hypothetical protein